MSTVHRTAFAEGVTLRAAAGGDVLVRGRFGELAIRRPSAGLAAALDALVAGGATEHALEELAGADAPRLFYHLETADGLGLLSWTVVSEGVSLATLTPVSPHFVRRGVAVDDGRAHRLSRFAYARADGHGRMIVECPLSCAAILVHDHRVASLVFELMGPSGARGLAERAHGLDERAVRAVVQLVADAAMLEPDAPEGSAPSPSEVALLQWEFHDLAFHARSRAGRHAAASGATCRFEGVLPPPPALKPPMSGVTVELHRPDLEALRRSDAPFTDVLERRRTVYARGSTPITARQLGELLFRAARVRGLRSSAQGEATDRTYPGAGARYELEIYPVVNECTGLPAGMYHYCPASHSLERLAPAIDDVQTLLEAARGPEQAPELPEVLLVISARFQRMSWRYESIAYSLILKDVGVLMQTVYLVATAMGLSPRALGRGDSDRFCRAAGTDYYVETSVGELALGGATG